MNVTLGRDEFHRWAQSQPRGRFERVRAAGLAAEAFPDGMTIEVGPDTDYEPDAVVHLGADPAPRAFAAPNPVIVVEVLSPGTPSTDRGAKLAGYFSVPSIVHYLLVSPRRRQVTHHRRVGDTIVSAVITEGEIALDPPGIAIAMNDIYRDARL